MGVFFHDGDILLENKKEQRQLKILLRIEHKMVTFSPGLSTSRYRNERAYRYPFLYNFLFFIL